MNFKLIAVSALCALMSLPAFAHTDSVQSSDTSNQPMDQSAEQSAGQTIDQPADPSISKSDSSSQSGQSMMDVQRRLSSLGYDVGSTDGKLGPKTKQAISKFQRDEGLKVSGRLDQQTTAQLFDAGEGRGVAGEASPDESMQRGGTMDQPAPSDQQSMPQDNQAQPQSPDDSSTIDQPSSDRGPSSGTDTTAPTHPSDSGAGSGGGSGY